MNFFMDSEFLKLVEGEDVEGVDEVEDDCIEEKRGTESPAVDKLRTRCDTPICLSDITSARSEAQILR